MAWEFGVIGKEWYSQSRLAFVVSYIFVEHYTGACYDKQFAVNTMRVTLLGWITSFAPIWHVSSIISRRAGQFEITSAI